MVTATRDTLTARERARWENDQRLEDNNLIDIGNNLNVLNTPDQVNHAIVFFYFNPNLLSATKIYIFDGSPSFFTQN